MQNALEIFYKSHLQTGFGMISWMMNNNLSEYRQNPQAVSRKKF